MQEKNETRYQRYYREHKEEISERSRLYYAEHKEEISEHSRLYYAEHKDYFKAYREQHREQIHDYYLKRKEALSKEKTQEALAQARADYTPGKRKSYKSKYYASHREEFYMYNHLKAIYGSGAKFRRIYREWRTEYRAKKGVEQ